MRISDWSSDVCSSDLADGLLLHQRTDRAVDLLGHLRDGGKAARARDQLEVGGLQLEVDRAAGEAGLLEAAGHLLAERPELFQQRRRGGDVVREGVLGGDALEDRKSTRLNSSH